MFRESKCKWELPCPSNLSPLTCAGKWLAKARLKARQRGEAERDRAGKEKAEGETDMMTTMMMIDDD